VKVTQEYDSRYARQTILPQMGLEGQEKLTKAKVLVIGCGGLGGPVLSYLAAAGVGTIGLIEFDTVSLSNLHRQIIFETKDIGQPKIAIAEQKIKALNPNVQVLAHNTPLSSKNALEIFVEFDLIVDGSDNFPTRYLVNDACEILNKPFVYGAIHQMEGQVSVFNYKGSCTYRDLYNTPPDPETAPNCAVGGVLGPIAGVIGSLQAVEAIKIICGIESPLFNEILVVEFQSMTFRKFKLTKNTERPKISALIDYEAFCASKTKDSLAITKDEFMALEKENIYLIDIRETYEHEEFNIGGENIPMDEFEDENLRPNKTTILYCASGIRSKTLANKIFKTNPKANVRYLDCSLKEFI
jgi:sulfur-carrier protein adenylyltransferase/sulfurtransferase